MRVRLLQDAARRSGYTIDWLDAITDGLSAEACERVLSNIETLPDELRIYGGPMVVRMPTGCGRGAKLALV